jgi:hypothetical protein
MQQLQCRVGEAFWIGKNTRIQLTGRIDETLYLFVDAPASQWLDAVDGFHASAPGACGRVVSHVFALCDGQGFTLAPISLRFEDKRLDLPGATALRDVVLWIDAPMHQTVVRESRLRPKTRPKLHATRVVPLLHST